MPFVTASRIRRRISGHVISVAGCAILWSGCAGSETSAPEQELARDVEIPAQWTATTAPSIALSGVTHATLRAWEDTRPGLPPLTISAGDSLVAFNNLLFAAGARWYETNGTVAGTPLPVEYYRNSAVAARAAMIEIAHNQGGFFLVWRGTEPIARKVNAAEIAAFLGMFGITVEYR